MVCALSVLMHKNTSSLSPSPRQCRPHHALLHPCLQIPPLRLFAGWFAATFLHHLPAPLPQAGDDASLQRLLFTLAPPARAALLRLLPALAVRLNAAGVDMARAAKDPRYRGPAAAAVAAAAAADKQVAAMKLQKQQQQQGQVAQEGSSSSARSVPRLPVDLFGFVPVSEQRLTAVEAALDELAAAAAALQAAVESLDPEGLVGHKALPPSLLHAPGSTPSTASASAGAAETADGSSSSAAAAGPVPVSDLRRLRALVREYVAADAAWADAQQQLGGGGRGALGQEEKRRMATVGGARGRGCWPGRGGEQTSLGGRYAPGAISPVWVWA